MGYIICSARGSNQYYCTYKNVYVIYMHVITHACVFGHTFLSLDTIFLPLNLYLALVGFTFTCITFVQSTLENWYVAYNVCNVNVN